MANTSPINPVHIGLFQLDDKDKAVIQRVIAFSSTQGKQYQLHSNVEAAHIVFTTDGIPCPSHQAIHIKITDHASNQDLVLKRPLLVTRVMRALDEAAQLASKRPLSQTVTAFEASVIERSAAYITVNTTTDAVRPEQPSTITLKSNPKIETTSIETPIAKPEPISALPVHAQTLTTKYLALVVDDSAAIRKQLELELKSSDIEADFVETGEEALEKVAQKHYDLVFLDIIMPGINGYDVCKAMRKRPEMKKTPIIMLSGKTSPLDEVQGVIAGASTYLTKPVDSAHFQKTLQRVAKWLTNFAAKPVT